MYEFSSGVATCVKRSGVPVLLDLGAFQKITYRVGDELAAVIIAQNDAFQFMALVNSSKKID
ncbi:hypothetical protein GCM10028774_65930 [Spirosoma jeollabukense]